MPTKLIPFEPKYSADGHALLSMSGAAREMQCPASVVLGKDIKGKSSDAAKEGSVAHEYIEKALPLAITSAPYDTFNLHKKEYGDKLAILASIPDPEMRQHVTDYLSFIEDLVNDNVSPQDTAITYLIEDQVHITNNRWGTLDFACFIKRERNSQAFIVDFKYGRYPVVAKDNWQLLSYAIALGNVLDWRQEVDITAIIYQPRAGGEVVQKWDFNSTYARQMHSKLMQSERKILKMIDKEIPLEFKAGDHCKFCKAAGVCPELNKVLIAENKRRVELLPNEVASEVSAVSTDILIDIWQKKALITDYLEAIEQTLQERLTQGESVPGLKLVQSKPRRTWKKDITYVQKELSNLGVMEPLKPALKTIGEIERLVGKGKIGHLTELTPGSVVLAAESDLRDAIDTTSPLSMIGVIPTPSTEGND